MAGLNLPGSLGGSKKAAAIAAGRAQKCFAGAQKKAGGGIAGAWRGALPIASHRFPSPAILPGLPGFPALKGKGRGGIPGRLRKGLCRGCRGLPIPGSHKGKGSGSRALAGALDIPLPGSKRLSRGLFELA